MITPTLEYIETDFSDSTETLAEYRYRTALPRKRRGLRLLFATR